MTSYSANLTAYASNLSAYASINIREIKVASLPAAPRHTSPPLWLLPSGPDQINGLSLRGDQQRHHKGGLLTLGRNYTQQNRNINRLSYVFSNTYKLPLIITLFYSISTLLLLSIKL